MHISLFVICKELSPLILLLLLLYIKQMNLLLLFFEIHCA